MGSDKILVAICSVLVLHNCCRLVSGVQHIAILQEIRHTSQLIEPFRVLETTRTTTGVRQLSYMYHRAVRRVRTTVIRRGYFRQTRAYHRQWPAVRSNKDQSDRVINLCVEQQVYCWRLTAASHLATSVVQRYPSYQAPSLTATRFKRPYFHCFSVINTNLPLSAATRIMRPTATQSYTVVVLHERTVLFVHSILPQWLLDLYEF